MTWKKDHAHLGFDFERACTTLIQWLVAAGILTESHLDEVSEVVDAAQGIRRITHSVALVELARVHGQLHFFEPPELAGRPHLAASCPKWPCQAAAMSFALWELGDYVWDIAGGAPQLAADLDYLGRHITQLDTRALSNIRHFGGRMIEEFAQLPVGDLGLDQPWARMVGLVAMLEQVPAELAQLAAVARESISSPQLLHTPSRKGGRRGDALLTAVWQHLDEGGFSFREIARLIPDSNAGDESARMKRISKRVGGRDCRSVRPWYCSAPDNGTAERQAEGAKKPGG